MFEPKSAKAAPFGSSSSIHSHVIHHLLSTEAGSANHRCNDSADPSPPLS